MSSTPDAGYVPVEIVKSVLVAVAKDKFSAGHDSRLWTREEGDPYPPYLVTELTEALQTEHGTDAHLVACIAFNGDNAVRAQPRLTKDGLDEVNEHGFNVRLNVLIADIDTPDHKPITDAQVTEAREKLSAAGVTCGWYTSRAGLRLVQPITSLLDPDTFERTIDVWLEEVRKVFPAPWVVDPACRDWTRHFRLPFVQRDGVMTKPVIDFSRMTAIVPPKPRPRPPCTPTTPRVAPPPTTDLEHRLRRARAYVGRVTPPKCGDGKCQSTLFDVALVTVKGFSIHTPDALDIVAAWAEMSSHKWKDKEVVRAVENAAKTGVPDGYLLTGDRPTRTQNNGVNYNGGNGIGVDDVLDDAEPFDGAQEAGAAVNADVEVEAEAEAEEGKRSTIDLLIEAIENMHPYRILTGRVFVNFGDTALPVDGQRFLHRIANLIRRDHCRNVTEAIVKNALLPVLGGELPSGHAPIRYADDGAGGIVLDLARKDGTVVEITRTGCVLTKSKISFYRPDGTRPMPVPVFPVNDTECAKVMADYYTMLGLDGNANRHARVCSYAWKMSSMRPMEWGSRFGKCAEGDDEADTERPLTAYTVVPLAGAEGSGKTTFARCVSRTIDPREPDLTALPEKIDDLVIVAENTHLMPFDNASMLTKEMSDALCRTATGDGNRKRSLYSNRDLSVFRGSRPVMLNGITDVVREADLLDRSLVVRLQPLARRKTEKELGREFKQMWPRVLGALCYCVSKAIAKLDDAEVPEEMRTIRMIDACMFAAAAEEVAGFEKGAVVKAYKDSKAEAVITVAEDPIVTALFSVVAPDTTWEGTTGELLDELTREAKGTDSRKPLSKRWPTEARGLTAVLKRLQTTLAALGVKLSFPTGANGGHGANQRIMTVTRSADGPMSPVTRSSPRLDAQEGNDDELTAVMELAGQGWAVARRSPNEPSGQPSGQPSGISLDRNGPPDGPDGSDGWLAVRADVGSDGQRSPGHYPQAVDGGAPSSPLQDQKEETTVGTVGTVGDACPQAQNPRRLVPTVGGTVGTATVGDAAVPAEADAWAPTAPDEVARRLAAQALWDMV